MKKYLAMLLVLCMIGSIAQLAAWAEGDFLPEEFLELEELLPAELIPEEETLPAAEEIPVAEELMEETLFTEEFREVEALEDFTPLGVRTLEIGGTYVKLSITYNILDSSLFSKDHYVGIALKGPGDDDWIYYWADEASSLRGRVGNTLGPEERTLYGLTPGTTYTRFAFLMDENHKILAQTGEVTFTTKNETIPSDNIANFVLRCYTRGLGRPEEQVREKDIGGLGYWYDILKTKRISPAEVGKYFAVSEESQAKYPGDGEFIAMLYRLFMEDRSYDQGGYDYWLGLLESKTLTREQIIDYFGISPEFQGIVESYGL